MTDKRSPSNAESPDLDWSQVRETMQMLRLSSAQIGYALSDSDDSISHLAQSFMQIHQHMKEISNFIQSETKHNSAALEHCNAADNLVKSAIISFQFYDKLSQRMTHVAEAMSALSSVVGDSSRLYNPNEWKKLQNLIKSKYSTIEEEAIFEALLNGKDFNQALEELNQAEADSMEDVDLF
ncbi:MAG: hypothetical protein ACWA5R_01460 [bacterium]